MYRKALKPAADFVLAAFLLPFWLLLLLVVAILIVIQDRGPVFYAAPRLGKNGKVFNMIKFRSMVVRATDFRNPDGSTFNSEDDPRVTKIGRFLRKTSLDETPQLINVLRGEMSFIGPRPDLPEHRSLYLDDEPRKLEVKPGITGYSQAHYRNAIPWKERIRKDIYYIDNLSFLLDLTIVFRTLVAVFRRKNIFVPKDGEDKV